MAKRLRMGVVGLGMGTGHVRGYQAHPRAEVAAICDVDEKRLQAAAKEYGVSATYTDAGEMFRQAGLDAVSIATPNKFHAPLSIAALKAGLHVLCEKPMAMNAREAQKMLDAAKAAKRNLMINFSYRFTDVSRALKQQVDAGVLGDIYFGRTVWHRRRGMPKFGGWFGIKELAGGGPLIDLGVHRLDLALWLMGYPEPVVVTGSAYNKIAAPIAKKAKKTFTVEDLACGMVKFANGATLIIEASWALHIKHAEHMVTRLCGTKGGLVQRNVGGKYEFEAEIYTDEPGGRFTRTIDRVTAGGGSAMGEFVDSILEKRAPLATGEEGLKVMKILDGIYKSAQTGREVRYR
ncbi:MAG: Gfo/Idh/MocA family oxidoreductase [Kiritimatiellae bacterium]|nr:Gfo/Idh/MocA family oxidoreductase [Kiritimatiellia bacterium]